MKLKLSAIVALALASSASLGAAEKLTTDTINVISATPLPSIGIPLNIIPANIQITRGNNIKDQGSVTVADYMINNLQGITFNETQGNPFQPDVTFRGYSASPLAGTPQGISIYVDGVRQNEPFADTVSWDLIPTFAVKSMQLIPGSNPVYGLNTLGGSLSLQTKSGRDFNGGAFEAEFGSGSRDRQLAEYGGVSKDGSVDYYFGVQRFDEAGWRQYSPSTVNQYFGKIGWQSESSKLDLSYTGADNKLTGNGLVPWKQIYRNGTSNGDQYYDTINTSPDETKNDFHQLVLNGAHWLNKDVMLTGNAYYRHSNKSTVNGDLNDTFDEDNLTTQNDGGGTLNSRCGVWDGGVYTARTDTSVCSPAVMNKTKTYQDSVGLSFQAAFNQDIFNKKNQLIVGVGTDYSRIRYNQSQQYSNTSLLDGTASIENLSWFNADRSLKNLSSTVSPTVNLHGKTNQFSLFATDTISLTEQWHFTGAARYNYTDVQNKDKLNGDSASNTLSGDHTYNRINPSVGLTFTPNQVTSVYGSYSESSRAPSSIELGCADKNNPCLLQNAMAGDPHLNQVVAKTYEAGMRGKLLDNISWSVSAYRGVNHQDIQFIFAGGSTNRGYFDNVGNTVRQGLDLSLAGNLDRLNWRASYSYISAEYDNDLQMWLERNPASGATYNAEGTNSVTVKKGSSLPGIPEHQLKLRAQYSITPSWNVAFSTITYSSQYVQGNNNNLDKFGPARYMDWFGSLPGYTVLNFDSQFKIGNGWNVFAKANNLLDNQYYTAGALGYIPWGTTGSWTDNSYSATSVAPGQPRSAWIGVRYEFGGSEKKY